MARYTKGLVEQQVLRAGIPLGKRREAERQILEALRYLRLNEKIATKLYCPKRRVAMGVRQLHTRPGHPSYVQERIYLINTLFKVWLKAFGKRPRVNRRGSCDTSFVIFAEPILLSAGVFNVLDNLNLYRSHYNKLAKEIDHQGFVEVKIIDP